jgi:Leucine-rich repeat (LRR) protein
MVHIFRLKIISVNYMKIVSIIVLLFIVRIDILAQNKIDTKGLRQGKWVEYYQDGKIKSNGYYRDGIKDSKWIFFDSNGHETKKEYYNGIEIKEKDSLSSIFQNIINSLNFTWNIFFGLITLLLGLITLLFGNNIYLRIKQWEKIRFSEKCRLSTFFTSNEIKNAVQYFVPTKCQNIDPAREAEPGNTSAFATKEDLIPFFINNVFKDIGSDDKYYLVLADSGMGKTTFLINLYIQYSKKRFLKKYRIKIIPLGYSFSDDEIDQINSDDHSSTILLLDAFDEDSKAVLNYEIRMMTLLQKTNKFFKVIFTCRTQFFPNQEDEPKETGIQKFGGEGGEYIFHKVYLSPFDDKDIKRYIRNKFSVLHFIKRKKSFKIVKQTSHLTVRPMLLNYIDDIIGESSKYEYQYNIYESLVEKWIKRESEKYRGDKDKFKKDLYRFSCIIALDIYNNRENRGGLFIDNYNIQLFAQQNRISLTDIEMKSRSLLNRDARGNYKFSHKSILEFFLFKEAIENKSFGYNLKYDGFDQLGTFLLEYYTPTMQKYIQSVYINGKNITIQKLNFSQIRNVQKLEINDYSCCSGYRINIINRLEYKSALLTKEKTFNLQILYLFINLQKLSIRNVQVIKFINLNFLKNIDEIHIESTNCNSITFLKGMNNLKNLYISGTQINDVSALNGIINLESLSIDSNKINDIKILNELKELICLKLYGKNIRYLASIRNLTKLELLIINDTSVSDINALKGLKNLKILKLINNNINNIIPLSYLNQLEKLCLISDNLANISSIGKLQNLKYLKLKSNYINDISILGNLSNLEYLELTGFKTTDISPLGQLTNLRYLFLSKANISDLSPLENLNNLEVLSLIDVEVPDYSPIKNIKNLRKYNINKSVFDLKENITEIPRLTIDIGDVT